MYCLVFIYIFYGYIVCFLFVRFLVSFEYI